MTANATLRTYSSVTVAVYQSGIQYIFSLSGTGNKTVFTAENVGARVTRSRRGSATGTPLPPSRSARSPVTRGGVLTKRQQTAEKLEEARAPTDRWIPTTISRRQQ